MQQVDARRVVWQVDGVMQHSALCMEVVMMNQPASHIEHMQREVTGWQILTGEESASVAGLTPIVGDLFGVGISKLFIDPSLTLSNL